MSEYDVLINKYDALKNNYDQLYPKPMKHADTHANGGTDPITPSDIGAYNKNETDTLLANKMSNALGQAGANLFEWASAQPVGGTFYINPLVTTVGAPIAAWCAGLLEINGSSRRMIVSTSGEGLPLTYVSITTAGVWQGWERLASAAEVDTKVSKSGGVMTGELAIRMDGVDTNFLNSAEALIIRSVESGGWDSRRTLQIKTKTAQPDFNKSLTYSRSDDGWLEYVLLHTGNAQTLGFPKIVMGSYVGTGTYYTSNPNTLNFDFEPKVLIVVADGANSSYPGFVIVRGQGYSNGIGSYSNSAVGYALTIAWSGNSVSWYTNNTFDHGRAYAQLNAEGVTYRYIALG